MRRKSKETIPPPPSINEAMESVQGAADRSMLPQFPYAEWYPGLGWFVSSRCTDDFRNVPVETSVIYPVAVLPTNYYRPSIPLW